MQQSTDPDLLTARGIRQTGQRAHELATKARTGTLTVAEQQWLAATVLHAIPLLSTPPARPPDPRT